ncbi:MAG: tetratricopeptide repeat protein [bacterium]
MSKPLPLKLLISLSLIVAIYITFSHVLKHEFIHLDDDLYVTENIYIQKGLTKEGLLWAFTKPHAGLWIPLTWISFMIDSHLFGLNAGGYYLTNLLLHIINALLLFLILKGITGSLWKSAFVAFLFALHPLRVESVAWVTERKDLLSSLFFLLTIWAYANYIKGPNYKRYIPVFIFFALGLMAKPMIVTLPFILLFLDYWPLGRFGSEGVSGMSNITGMNYIKRTSMGFLVLEKIPLFLLSALTGLMTLSACKDLGYLSPLDVLPLLYRITNAAVYYVKYIGMMILPVNLAILYPHTGILPMWQAAGAILILSFISLAIWRLHRPYLFTGWLWYLFTLLPVIGIVQAGSQGLADRFTYIPLIGLFIMITWGIPELFEAWLHRTVFLAVSAVLVLLTLMLCTIRQVRYWQDSVRLFEHTLDVTDNNWLIHFNLGLALVRQGKVEEGILHYQEALRITPDSERAHNNLAVALAGQGKIQEAAFHYSEALRIKPDHETSHFNLGFLLTKQGRIEEGIDHYLEAIKIRPDFAKAHFHLGLAFLEIGDRGAAAEESEILKGLSPELADMLSEKINAF